MKKAAKSGPYRKSFDAVLDPLFNFQNLTTTVHPCFDVHMVRAMKFASCLVFNISVRLNRIMSATHTAL